MGIGITVYRTFKPIIDIFIYPFFKDIKPYLKKAGIKKDLEEYLGEVFLYSIVISIIFGIFGLILTLIIIKLVKNPKLIILAPILMLILGLIGFTISLVVFRAYPSMVASSRKRKIENALYLATIYMATISTSGANPIAIFSLLAKYKEFSEISKEAQEIVQYVKGLGLDLPTALHIKALQSPSNEWKELLEGIRSILLEGGDLETFLYEKARQYVQEFKRKLIEYTNTMQVILELYITLIIVGIIFVLILTTLLGSIMGGSSAMITQIQQFLIFIFLPLSSIMFILLIKLMSPFEV